MPSGYETQILHAVQAVGNRLQDIEKLLWVIACSQVVQADRAKGDGGGHQSLDRVLQEVAAELKIGT
jgi:hypothetical protein